MELLQLRYFLTVARMLNISRAAQHHRIPQPAMSKTISKLEAEIGTPLFDRYKNKLSLTAEGEAFYHSVAASIGELDGALEQIHAPDVPLRGKLKLLVKQHRNAVVDSIIGFQKLHPEVDFQFVYEPETEDHHEFDLCISSAPPEDTFDNSACLITERLMLVVSREHPGAKETSIRFSELKEESFAIISRKTELWQQTLLQCQQAGFTPRISMVCGDLHCLIKYVGAGMGVTLGPEISWQGLKNDSVAFLPTVPAVNRSTYVFWNGSRNQSRLCTAYREYLVSYFTRFQELPVDNVEHSL